MSFKADTLLKKATTFERLSLYGNRKAFLAALAQDPREAVSAYNALSAAVKQLNSAIQQFIATSSEVQTELPGRTKGLPTTMAGPAGVIRQAAESGVDAGNMQQVGQAAAQLGMLRNLGNMGADARNAWLNTVSPAALAVSDAVNKVPAAQPVPQAPEQTNEMAMPQDQIKGRKPNFAPDPGTVGLLQKFLNNAYKQQIIGPNASMIPIEEDSKLGPETMGRLSQWARDNKVRARDLQDLINIALGRK